MPDKIIKLLEIKSNYDKPAFKSDYIFLKYSEKEKNKEKKESSSETTLVQDYTDTALEILNKTYATIGDIISLVEDMNFFTLCLADIKRGQK